MMEFQVEDALASAPAKAAQDDRVRRVIACTPGKDLAQCLRGKESCSTGPTAGHPARRSRLEAKYRVRQSIPDYRHHMIGVSG